MRIGFIGLTEGTIKNGFTKNSNIIMSQSGQNTGNLAFWSGFSNILPKDIIQVEWHSNPEEIKKNIDILVIAAANFLREDSDMFPLANLVEKIDKPVLIAGLGAESHSFDKIPTLQEGTIKFLKSVSDRCDYFGVRGEFSKTVCNAYGVNNAKVLGCPSVFMNCENNLGKKIETQWNKEITKFSTASASIKENLKLSERRVFLESILRNSSYILQRPEELFKCVLGEHLDESNFGYIDKFSNFIGISTKDLISFLQSNGKVFTSSFSWMDYVRHCSHTVNTRIHGTIFPIMAGVPSICITHDTRTKELCDTLKITSVPSDKFGELSLSLEEMFQEFNFDGNIFDENRRYLANEYKKLLNCFDIPSTHSLEDLI